MVHDRLQEAYLATQDLKTKCNAMQEEEPHKLLSQSNPSAADESKASWEKIMLARLDEIES